MRPTKCQKQNIRNLQQDQENITKTNKSQIKYKQQKPKLKPKQLVKANKEKRNLCQKEKVVLTNKDRLALFQKQLGKKVK